MNTKLTLTIEQAIIEKAKKYAKQKNRSLSDLIENYLKALTNEEPEDKEEELSTSLKALQGAFTMPADFNYKDELSDRLSEKYL